MLLGECSVEVHITGLILRTGTVPSLAPSHICYRGTISSINEPMRFVRRSLLRCFAAVALSVKVPLVCCSSGL